MFYFDGVKTLLKGIEIKQNGIGMSSIDYNFRIYTNSKFIRFISFVPVKLHWALGYGTYFIDNKLDMPTQNKKNYQYGKYLTFVVMIIKRNKLTPSAGASGSGLVPFFVREPVS